MGRLLDALFGRRKRQNKKLKALLNLAVCRLGVLSKDRHAQWSDARSDLLQLLLLLQQERALLRAELVIKEQNMIDAFAMVEAYCRLLMDRIFLIQPQKECPEELREAAAGLCFAASRCGDLPELQKIRKILSSRFGKGFTIAAVELRNNCGVNGKLVQNFSARQPSLESRIIVMNEIARENGIKFDLITNLFPEISSMQADEAPGLWIKTEAEEKMSPPPDSARDSDEKLEMRSEGEYKDIVSAAEAAFESAAYAAVAAKAAVELFRSESEPSVSSERT
ncbi:hypothetical protein KSP40_PGU018626 [Platanthera guangdongensis]|uniref:Regulator of Vps4 activity in the MVB pathway protein n=1 Tax=Platanthera guangdongensis TaxID=2320717 RepID=A0ABR2N562_9ASPA